ncbi:DDE-type integrase/transposase/recombinase [Comamonas aquatica]|uniref:DDE-type integrase/transposase/recombinase n=1 Tax=Comamonas aquatica TaxID=225991 RepID=UPI00244BC9F6|nr:DDE-type integrase/transposase/recombinase [Comamonas aquatica]MDH0202121.1 DDE-type integrase/transposase/recombinase [Comamonas aquatica]MDH0382338.1 DDE-type integrase/transposase/recombinase [Comamonas aquatica]MDH0430539.1 DDE-type integrase/transposase/recombinase [Comamonas aquatica]MDH0941474.1 DDE-type integrase/transposase/recombinase [Comamonas aquatica]MDH1380085.1 DDE-type integrase/transposase/recombinase [Comamonas aquatica]
MIDCYSRELLGWHLSRSGRSKTAEAALEQALIARYGCLGKVRHPFLLRSDNGLVFTSRSYTALVKSYGLQQEFITPYSPEQNGMVERVIRTLTSAELRDCIYALVHGKTYRQMVLEKVNHDAKRTEALMKLIGPFGGPESTGGAR